MAEPVSIAVTGAAGQIGYALLFRIASGAMLGPDQPVELKLLEIPPAMDALQGVVMELDDCAFPLLVNAVATDQPEVAFEGVDLAMLVGSMPRGPGMERNDLLEANGKIFTVQGKALNDHASRQVKTLVVGNPANTNCLIAQNNAPDLDPNNFTAMTKLDHNRATAQLALKVACAVDDIQGLSIWGNHSSTMFPDLLNASVSGTPAMQAVDQAWYENEFIPAIQQRGAAIIAARGLSSAASAANAAVEHMREWVTGTSSVTSMGIYSSGAYGRSEGLIFSYPVTTKDGAHTIVEGLTIDDFAHAKIKATEQELMDERDAVAHLL